MVDHDDRLLVLREIHRVLAEDGLLLLGSLNKDGPLYMRLPWRRQNPRPLSSITRSVIDGALTGLLDYRHNLRVWNSWWSERGFAEGHREWAIAPRGSGRSLIVNFTTVSGLRTDLIDSGFELEAVFASEGDEVPLDARTAKSRWLHSVSDRV
jgi:SAM-dependent methyltransferase